MATANPGHVRRGWIAADVRRVLRAPPSEPLCLLRLDSRNCGWAPAGRNIVLDGFVLH